MLSYGILKHDNRMYVITEYARTIRNTNGDAVEPATQEIIDASVDSYKAAVDYDYRKIQPEVDLQGTVLREQRGYGRDHYRSGKISAYLPDYNEDVLEWLQRWVDYFATDAIFEQNYRRLFGFIHRDIHKGNIISTSEGPRLIDFEIAGIDNKLIDLTRPLVIFTDPNHFETAVAAMKLKADPFMTELDRELFDRIMILDLLTCNGYEIGRLPLTADDRVKKLLIRMITERLAYAEILMTKMREYNLNYL